MVTEKLNCPRCDECRFFELMDWERCGHCNKHNASACHLDRWCGDFEPIPPPEPPKDIREQMRAIPSQNFLHADRYDTDNEHVVHLWDDVENSYDIRVPKENATVNIRPKPEQPGRGCKTCKHSRMDGDEVHFTEKCLSCLPRGNCWEPKE